MTFTEITSKIYFLTGSNSASFPVADLTAAVNTAYDRAVSLILEADGRWQWDDTNQTDFPIATTTITTSQADYSLATTHLKILRVELKDAAGTWRLLTAIDQADYTIDALTQLAAVTGIPDRYDKLGTSIILYPTPSFTQAASLKIYFQRGPSYFTITDTTKAPGINALYHALLPVWAAYEYCIAKGLTQKLPALKGEIDRIEHGLITDYGRRDPDDRSVLTSSLIVYK